MTTILGYIDKDKSYVAADDCVSSWHRREDMKESKIFKYEDFMIGVTGRLKAINSLEEWSCPERGKKESLDDYIKITIKRSLRELFEKTELAGISDNILKDTDSTLLIVTNENIYYLNEDMSIYKVKVNFGAIGSGEEVGLGSLGLYQKLQEEGKMELSTREILEKTISLCSQFCIGVSSNAHILERSKK